MRFFKRTLFTILFPYVLLAQDNTYVAPDVNIISVTPVQGSGLDIDRVPGKIQTLSRDQLDKKKNFSITETLNRETTGISLFNLNSTRPDSGNRGYCSGSCYLLNVQQLRLRTWYGENVKG